MSRNRLLLTQSLLSAWLWMYKASDPQRAQEDFLKTLHRQPTPRTKPIQDGIQFENLVTAWCEGEEPEKGHKWAGRRDCPWRNLSGGRLSRHGH